MKILLLAINAKYIHSNPAIYDLRAYASRYRHETVLMEFTVNHGVDDILRSIYEAEPDVVAFSCYIWNITMVEMLLPELAKILPGMDIWLGGPEVSYDSRKCMERMPSIRGIMVGEGEVTFLELAGHYVEGTKELGDIEGLIYRDVDGPVLANPARMPMDFCRLPFPYEGVDDFQNRIVYYETSRGCPFSCSYCLSSIDKSVRLRDIGLVKTELQFFLDAAVPQVKFIDRTFNCSRTHAAAIWTYIREHDNGVTNFHFEIAAELLGEEEVRLLQSLRPGQVQLEIGVQTTNTRTLAAICRPAAAPELACRVDQLKREGNIHIHLDLIAGLPYEDIESFRKSFDEVYLMGAHNLQLGFLKVLKGTKMEADREEYGIVSQDRPPYEVLSTRWLSYSDILELKLVEEMLEVYGNSGQFVNSVRYLGHFFVRPYDLYLRIGRFYKDNALLQCRHGRMKRYEILFEFAETAAGIEKETFRQILVYDLYLRENMRSRPQFAPEPGGFKESSRSFFESGRYLDVLEGYGTEKPAQVSRMVHVEPVGIDIPASAACGRAVAADGCCLFDYRKRDALYHNASVIFVPAGVFGKDSSGG